MYEKIDLREATRAVTVETLMKLMCSAKGDCLEKNKTVSLLIRFCGEKKGNLKAGKLKTLKGS